MLVRPTTRMDIPAVDALLARSYPVLLKPDYASSVLVTAVPLISKAQPALVCCGTYYGVFDGNVLVGAGGWTSKPPGGSHPTEGVAHIRHVVTDPQRVRQGVGHIMMNHVFAQAQSAGIKRLMCQSTRTAEPFYQAAGFERLNEIEVPLAQGVKFPAVLMMRDF